MTMARLSRYTKGPRDALIKSPARVPRIRVAMDPRLLIACPRMASTLKLRRFGAVALAAGLLLSAPGASASDTFGLNNGSSTASLTGTSLWGKGNTMSDKCRTGPFPGPTLTAFTFNPGDRGSITLSENPFSKCLPGINPLADNPITTPGQPSGNWTWIPDDPFIGYASLTCFTTYEGVYVVGAAVDGLTCNVYDVSSAPAGSFTSSASPVRGGAAVAHLQHFPQAGTPAGSSSQGRYELILRDPKGGVHGRVKKTIVSGDSRTVRVPISRELREQVAEEDGVKVKAELKRIDGQPGTGDRTVLRVTKDHKSLPF
jgi:hypothetical protein